MAKLKTKITKKTKRVKKAKKVVKIKKKPKKAATAKKEQVKEPAVTLKPDRYLEAVGRRKTAVARVRFWTRGKKEILINDKPYKIYFPILSLQQTTVASLEKMKCLDRFRILVKVKGGGLHAQAGAIRQGTSRALILFNPDFRKRLRRAGFLTRDSRMRERKKFGLKRARRAPQWAKR